MQSQSASSGVSYILLWLQGKERRHRRDRTQAEVHTVLEGSVRKAGDRLRVTAQLINVGDGYHLWSERYDRQLEDVFEIQDEIAGNIVRALRVVLGEDEKRALEKPRTENVQAYEYYLRGRQIQHQMRRATLQYSRRMFDRAIEIDPNFARAHAGIADCCSFLYMVLGRKQGQSRSSGCVQSKSLGTRSSKRRGAHVSRSGFNSAPRCPGSAAGI